jgi:hypothetical protein
VSERLEVVKEGSALLESDGVEVAGFVGRGLVNLAEKVESKQPESAAIALATVECYHVEGSASSDPPI